MFQVFVLTFISLWLAAVGFIAWVVSDVKKRPWAPHDFDHEWQAYSSWLKSQLPDVNMLASLWHSHSPNAVNMPAIHWEAVHLIAYCIVGLAAAAYAINFIAQVVSMSGSHEGIALEFLGFQRSRTSNGDQTRRQETTENLKNFAEIVRDAGSGIRSIFYNGKQLDLTGLVTEMNARFVGEQDKKKMKTPRLEAAAKTWYLLLRGKLRPARNYYRAHEHLIEDGNLVSLLKEDRHRFIFMLQTTLVMKFWQHPMYLQVEVEQPDGKLNMLNGMAALFEIQALAPILTKPKIKSTYARPE
jgi:hypothetical protein